MLEDPQTPRDPESHNHNAHCPICGQPAISDVTRLVRGVYLARYEDVSGHEWDTRWLASAA